MNNLNNQHFQMISEYLKELKTFQKLASYTIARYEPVLDREMLQVFLSRLPYNLRQTASRLGILNLEELAEKLDPSIFLMQNLNLNTSTKENFIKNYFLKKTRYRERGKKFCPYHKTSSHSENDCYVLKKEKRK